MSNDQINAGAHGRDCSEGGSGYGENALLNLSSPPGGGDLKASH